jgi:hypothetical protein
MQMLTVRCTTALDGYHLSIPRTETSEFLKTLTFFSSPLFISGLPSPRAHSKEVEDMSTKRSVRLVKKAKPKDPETGAEVEPVGGPNRWSTAVRSWVIEFQHRRGEYLPAFDSLFKREAERPH